jgi:hypothetical protein
MEGIVYEEDLYNLCPSEVIISVLKSMMIKRTKYVKRIRALAVKIENIWNYI